MLVDSSNSAAGATVTGAIRQAAQATGTSFQYLLATAKVESGLNPQAGAATSSARGLFQFIDQTWLATMKQSGASLGYGQYASAITQDASGHYQVADPAMRSQILRLRTDPTANAAMAGAFTQSNAAVLASRLGRPASEGELYIAHFLGAGGAAHLISSAAQNPNASAASYFPNAAQANPSIFYDRSTGATRSLAEVRNILTARYDLAARSAPVPAGSAVAQAATPQSRSSTAATDSGMPHMVRTIPIMLQHTASASDTAATVPDTAGMTSAFADATPAAPVAATDGGEIFHGLFSDPGRNTPVAAVVSQLWGASGLTSPSSGTAAPTAGMMHDLFRDDGSKA